ncbi:sister chromatid cohesion protein PDS5 [Thraustotheca clavata]|uniref:Sister chromatid cohesion protein PDS5 n=1 Tax=Thraustotheca clavata TaxID=74557 RepID=A0A1V9ZWJ1_9STRA|nr:sister chromatid cohesion protein PDS5 [Thraustotheca clavata]
MAAKSKAKARRGETRKGTVGSGRKKELEKELERLRGISNGDLNLEEAKKIGLELSSNEALENNDGYIRVLTASCCAQLLRIVAPEIPFASDQTLYDVFVLILQALKETNKSTDVVWFGLLETLASVKICNLAVGLQPEHDSKDLVIELFRCLFERLQDDHGANIEANMINIMVACLEESDRVIPAVLEVLLEYLLEPSKKRVYHTAQQVINKASDVLQNLLSLFFNSALVDVKGASENSALKEHTHTLIYEVHKINPSLLLYVLPNVCLQLQVDDLDTRSNAIALMGRLFASSHADYGAQYMKNFRDFLGRFRDKKKEIRLQMVQVCAIIAQRKPDLMQLIEPEMKDRLQDTEWEVRRIAMNELCDLAAKSVKSVSPACLREVGERMKDKKPLIRKEAMTGLAQIYAAHVSIALSQGNHEIPADAQTLSWVPDYVLKCFAYREQELKLRVVQLLDDILLPKSTTELHRMKGLIFMWKHLDDVSKEAFRRIMLERVASRNAMLQFIEIKNRMRQKKNANGQTPEVKHMQQVLKDLQPLLPETEGWTGLTEKLALWKDMKILKYLEVLCSPTSSSNAIRQAREDLIKMLGSKTPLGSFMKNVCRKLALLTINSSSLECLLSLVQEARDAKAVVEILHFIATSAPFLIEGHLSTLQTLLSDHTQPACVLDLLVAHGKHLKAQKLSSLQNNGLRKTLLEHCQNATTIDIVKKSARALCLLFQPFKELTDWAQKLFKESDKEDTELQALAAFTKYLQISNITKTKFDPLVDEVAESSKAKMKKKDAITYCLRLSVLVHIVVHQFKTDIEAARSLLDVLVKSLTSSQFIVRQTAAIGMLKMVCVPDLEAAIEVTEWHLLGYTMVDEELSVRQAFLKKLSSTLLRYSLPYIHKYVAFVPLNAEDPDADFKKQARSLLTMAVARLRHSYEARDEEESDEASSLMVPEYILPYTIHLVLHPPTPDHRCSDALKMLLDSLVSNVASEADNISFLLQMLHKMGTCHDIEDASSTALYKHLAQCSTWLKSKIKNQVNLKPYPGQIFLPKQLFAPGKVADVASGSEESEDEHKSKKRPSKPATGPRPKKAKPTPTIEKTSEAPVRRMPSRVAKADTDMAESSSDEEAEVEPSSSIRKFLVPTKQNEKEAAETSDEEETKGRDSDDEDMTSYRSRRRR